MPRYFFNLHNNISVTDVEGRELTDLDAAKKEAFKAAAELIGEQVASGRQIDPSDRIEVQDNEGSRVFTLCFAELIGPRT